MLNLSKKILLNATSKWIGFVFVLAITLSLSGCLSSEIRVTTIYEWSTCKGWDEAGNPVGFTEILSPEQQRIVACGRIESDDKYPQALTVNWLYEYENELWRVHREIIIVETDGYFYSIFHPSDMARRLEKFDSLAAFLPGHYEIDVVFGKTLVRTAEFQIE